MTDALRLIAFEMLVDWLPGLESSLQALGSAYDGYVYDGSYLHVKGMTEATPAPIDPETGEPVAGWIAPEDAELEQVILKHGALYITTDKTTLTADGVDTATIQSNDVALTWDSDVDYAVWLKVDERGGTLEAAGTATVTAGATSLTFNTDTAGTYVVEIKRQAGQGYESGYVVITAEEV